MKKFFALLLAAALCLALTPAGLAEDGRAVPGDRADEPQLAIPLYSYSCGEGLTCTLYSDGTVTVTGTGEMWGYYDYPELWETASEYFGTAVKKVVIYEGCANIGDLVFSACTRMTSVTVASSVKRVGERAFANCDSLNAVYIPDLAAWCETAFHDAEANPLLHAHRLYVNDTLVTALTLPDSVTRISGYAFCGCSVTGVSFGAELTEIGGSAFAQCGSLTELRFTGTAPSFGENCFAGVTATAWYPPNDPSWTDEVRQNYGGSITWTPYPGVDLSLRIDDHTKGKAAVGGAFRFSGDETAFTVSAEEDRAVLVLVESAGTYRTLPCTTGADGVHRYRTQLGADEVLTLIFKGDANNDGKVNMRDGLAIKKHTAGTEKLSGLLLLAADADANGKVNMRDGLAIKKQTAGTEAIAW